MKREEIRTINDMYLVSDMLKFKTEKATIHSLNDSGEYPLESMTIYGGCDNPTIKIEELKGGKNLLDVPELLEVEATEMGEVGITLLLELEPGEYTLSWGEIDCDENTVPGIFIYNANGEQVTYGALMSHINYERITIDEPCSRIYIGCIPGMRGAYTVTNLMLEENLYPTKYEPYLKGETKELVVPYELGEGDKLTLKDGAVKITTSEGVITDITDTEFGQKLLAIKLYCPTTKISCEADIEFEYKADTQSAYNNLLNLISKAIS